MQMNTLPQGFGACSGNNRYCFSQNIYAVSLTQPVEDKYLVRLEATGSSSVGDIGFEPNISSSDIESDVLTFTARPARPDLIDINKQWYVGKVFSGSTAADIRESWNNNEGGPFKSQPIECYPLNEPGKLNPTTLYSRMYDSTSVISVEVSIKSNESAYYRIVGENGGCPL
jgi:hypothetical protein